MAAPTTLAQKLVARAAGRDRVEPGEIVTCRVDLAMFHDSSGPRRLAPMLAELGARIRDPSRVVLVLDHFLPERDEESRRIVRIARDFAADAGLVHVHDGVGVCHVVLPEHGHLRPGMFVVGGDSHSPTGGAKDLMLMLVGRFGMNGGRYQAVEFAGSAVAAMPMAERMTLCNMAAELGAQTGLVAPDATTIAWLEAHGVAPQALAGAAQWRTDPGAALAEDHGFDAAALRPMVARPHSPANAHPVDAVAGERIDVAYLGACTGAKLDDLRAAARVLRGRRIAAGVTLMLAPASLAAQRDAEAEGVWQALLDAGATALPTGCGACAGYGGGFAEGARVISSTARNFKGRMGAASAEVFLGSPYTVAASALRGAIADPREVLR